MRAFENAISVHNCDGGIGVRGRRELQAAMTALNDHSKKLEE